MIPVTYHVHHVTFAWSQDWQKQYGLTGHNDEQIFVLEMSFKPAHLLCTTVMYSWLKKPSINYLLCSQYHDNSLHACHFSICTVYLMCYSCYILQRHRLNHRLNFVKPHVIKPRYVTTSMRWKLWFNPHPKKTL